MRKKMHPYFLVGAIAMVIVSVVCVGRQTGRLVPQDRRNWYRTELIAMRWLVYGVFWLGDIAMVMEEPGRRTSGTEGVCEWAGGGPAPRDRRTWYNTHRDALLRARIVQARQGGPCMACWETFFLACLIMSGILVIVMDEHHLFIISQQIFS